MEPIVVKLSGSLVYPPRADYLGRLAGVLRVLRDRGARVGVVVGGGPVAREYIAALRSLGHGQGVQDLAGIWSARLNAFVLALALGDYAVPRVPETIEEAVSIARQGFITVMGGLQPGQSTNAVALALAEALGARLVVNALRGVAGVYDRDPREPGARLLDRITLDDLARIVEGYSQEAGKYVLLDHVALHIARRSRIKIVFVDGSNPDNILRASLGESVGTIVEPL